MSAELVNIALRICTVSLILLLGGAEFYISWIRTDLYIRYLDWVFGKSWLHRFYILNREQNIWFYVWALRIGSIFALVVSFVVLFKAWVM